MKKLINSPADVLTESLAGFAAAHADLVELSTDPVFVRRRTLTPGKVAVISGGGSGHEPLHAGFVGQGMLDAACPGQVFTSPTPDQMIAAAQAVDQGAGVLFVVKNYEGDKMNFEMAAEMAADLVAGGTATVMTDDDVAVEKSTWSIGRRGVAGTLVVEKVVGAAAEEGMGLADLADLGRRVNAATRSMGIALSSCTVPAAGTPTFTLAEDEMEMGVGIHGEPGRRRVKVMTADAIAEEMVAAITGDFATAAGAGGGAVEAQAAAGGTHSGGPDDAGTAPDEGEVLLLVNGFGGTPLMELYLMYHAARTRLEARGYRVARSLVGNFVTSLEMAGCSLTVTRLDAETTRLWDAPVRTAGLRWGV
jgi:dihydroxyacetone kinase-like protein